MLLLISSYVAYNAWANQRMIHWLRTLERDLLYREVPSSFPSIDYTLLTYAYNSPASRKNRR